MKNKKHFHQPLTVRHIVMLALKFMIIFSILVSVISVFKLRSLRYSSSEIVEKIRRVRSHGGDDEVEFVGVGKVAFMFLVKRGVPLDFLWGNFFKHAEEEKYSIYIHSEPGFVFDDRTTRSVYFYGRQLSKSVQVVWGESSMIEAERMLFREALEDPANQRFVLLSDSCVPLHNFSYIYNYIMSSPKSFVDSFIDVKGNRYHPKMSYIIPQDQWRKGSQWITLVRRHAEVVVDDDIILPVFKKFCKRRPPIDPAKGKLNIKLQKQHNCIPDEHYVQTLLAMGEFEDELERRTLTYTSWNVSKAKMEKTGWHPVTFNYATAGPQQIREIKDLKHVYYETEFRTEWCSYNASSAPCFLFARKFSPGAALRLLNDGIVGPYTSSMLLQKLPG